MSFVSLEFIVLFIFLFFLYWLVAGKYRYLVVLVASCLFYSGSNLRNLPILLYVTLVSYICSSRVLPIRRYRLFPLALIIILVPLLLYKYTGFVIDTLSFIFGKETEIIVLGLPLGVSFYTFSALAYFIDCYNKKTEPSYGLLKYASGIAFFPCLISGPIERQQILIPQLLESGQFEYDKVSYGLKLTAWGLFQKVVVADNIAVFVDAVYADLNDCHGLTVLLAVFLYSIQIYSDFSGYSDMARGIALMLGISITKNFNCPYFSMSIKEFWGRWHISLSTWFRDYIYIPLGGNKKGKIKRLRNIMITMLVSGLWHGAAWRYVIWGGMHGLLQCVESIIGISNNRKCLQYLKMITVFCICSFLWILFRADSFNNAMEVVARIPQLSGMNISLYQKEWVRLGFGIKSILILACEILVLLFYDMVSQKADVIKCISEKSLVVRWGIYVIFVISIAWLSYKGAAAPFVYNGF